MAPATTLAATFPPARLDAAVAVSAAFLPHDQEIVSTVGQLPDSKQGPRLVQLISSGLCKVVSTEKQGNPATLGADEAKLYGLIARQYLLQFYPPFEYNDSKVLLRIAGGLFQAKARRILKAGWKALLGVEEDDEEEAGTLSPPSNAHSWARL